MTINLSHIKENLERFLRKNYASGLEVGEIEIEDDGKEIIVVLNLECEALMMGGKEWVTKSYLVKLDDGESRVLNVKINVPTIFRALQSKKIFKEMFWVCVQMISVYLGSTIEPTRIRK